MKGVQLHILRSDGGLSSARSGEDSPVNLLMSGPAGGVTGALVGRDARRLQEPADLDMGGTSTDVALIENGEPRPRARDRGRRRHGARLVARRDDGRRGRRLDRLCAAN